MVEQLRREADIVMVISHAGEKTDEELAAGVPGIDIIIGGHSHTRLPAGEFIWRSDDLEKDAVNGTVVVQAYQWGGELGRLDLLFAKDASGKWCVSRYRARLIPVTPDVPGDQTVSAVVSRYWDPIKARFGEVIGVATADFVQRGDDLAQYNLVADAVRSAYGADIEFENMFGVRSPLIKGKLTLADLVDLDPFGNTIVTFRITGRQLKEILLKHKPAVSGLRYRIDGGRLAELTVGGRPVDDNAVYTGVTNSYFRGVALQGIEAKDTGRTRLDAIIEHIRKKGTISPVYDGRRIVVGPAGPQR
jgi:5'-nucleotidase